MVLVAFCAFLSKFCQKMFVNVNERVTCPVSNTKYKYLNLICMYGVSVLKLSTINGMMIAITIINFQLIEVMFYCQILFFNIIT